MDYASEYELGFNVLVDTIKMLKANSQHVEVILVQGNHDRTKSYYLAHALDIYFKEDDNISFIREESLIKATVVGNTFIGFHHGNCKVDALSLLSLLYLFLGILLCNYALKLAKKDGTLIFY